MPAFVRLIPALLLGWLLVASPVWSGERGSPLVEVYDAQQMLGANISTDLLQLPDGRVCVANMRGLFRFDGARWELTGHPKALGGMQFLSLDEPLPSGSALALSSDEPGPEQVTMSNERGQLIQGLLDQLKPDDRAAIMYRYWYDYSYAEIADVLDSTESAIKSRLFRARRLLADLYQERFDEPADDDRPINPRLLQE